MILAVLVLALACSHPWTQSAGSSPGASDAAQAGDRFAAEQALLDASRAAYAAVDYAGARALAADAVSRLLSGTRADDDTEWLRMLERAGRAARQASDSRTSNAAFEALLAARTRTLPDDDAALQTARQLCALSRRAIGNGPGALELDTKVVEVAARTHAPEDPELLRARANLALTLRTVGNLDLARSTLESVVAGLEKALPADHADILLARDALALTLEDVGDLAGARTLLQSVLDARARTLPLEHPTLQSCRQRLAIVLRKSGALQEAHALNQQIYDIWTRTLAEDEPEVTRARQNLAITMGALGDLDGACKLQLRTLEICTRDLPDDDPDLQRARENLGITLLELGDTERAFELFGKVLEVRTRTLRPDDPELTRIRASFGSALAQLGDFERARTLFEDAYGRLSRTLPDNSPELTSLRQNLAAARQSVGDYLGARQLFEQVLELRSRELPEDHPLLLDARVNLAVNLQSLDDLAGARALLENVVAARSRTQPEDQPDLLAAEQNLAAVLERMGELPAAHALEQKVLGHLRRALGDDHPRVLMVSENLAVTEKALGNTDRARELEEAILAVRMREPDVDPLALQRVRINLAQTIACQIARSQAGGAVDAAERDRSVSRCRSLVEEFAREGGREAARAVLADSSREAEERGARASADLAMSLSFAAGLGVFGPLNELDLPAFVFAETTRGAAIRSAALQRRTVADPRSPELRAELARASAQLSNSARAGVTGAEFDRLRTRREQAERTLVDVAREISAGSTAGLEFDPALLGERIGESSAIVTYRRYKRTRLEVGAEPDPEGRPWVHPRNVESLCAFVARRPRVPGGALQLTRFDLGPIDPVESAVRNWRASVGASAGRGIGSVAVRDAVAVEPDVALRRLVFDPLMPALAGTDHLVVVPDDVLHLVPFDALRVDVASGALLGDRYRLETRATTWELCVTRTGVSDGGFVGIGGVDYEGLEPATAAAPALREQPQVIEASWTPEFQPLPGTHDELNGISEAFARTFGDDAPRILLEKEHASKARFLDSAPRARWLHVATHGWFANASIPSWSDPEPVDQKSGLVARGPGAERIRGLSPMLLCGLALTGANRRGADAGMVTAAEVAALDLSGCDLAVLSACESGLGERRDGQGLASLQKALQMAGARSVVTALWRVPDEATRVLMLDFYRRLWAEKTPTWRALWDAKRALREARDENGMPRYSTRDWAAWVLTGEPG